MAELRDTDERVTFECPRETNIGSDLEGECYRLNPLRLRIAGQSCQEGVTSELVLEILV
jgi:hypothetical protein